MYPVAYINSLEERCADLERQLRHHLPALRFKQDGPLHRPGLGEEHRSDLLLQPDLQGTSFKLSIPPATAISSDDAASFFVTYFDMIHRRYPFLDVGECSDAYLKYKAGVILTGWPDFMINMVRTPSTPFTNPLMLSRYLQTVHFYNNQYLKPIVSGSITV